MRLILSTSPHIRHPNVLMNDFRPEPSSMYTFSPVGLLSLIGTVKRDQLADVTMYDVNRDILRRRIPLDETFHQSVARRIAELRPDAVGFMTECDSYHHVLQIATATKALLPQCAIGLGGPHATAVATFTMDRYAAVDFVVLGEAERSFTALLRDLQAGAVTPIPGVLRRASDGTLLDGGPAPLVDDLDDLALPAYDSYVPEPGEELFVEVGRGCPFQCTFCSTAPFWQRRHRVKSPARIVQELQWLKHLFACERVHFIHDLFTTDRTWVRDVCRALVGANTPVRWTCSSRTDTVNETLLQEMAQAGCDSIYFGLESGSPRILRDIRKNIPLETSFSVLQACIQNGIKPNAGFIVGFPGEDAGSFHDTFEAYGRALELGARPVHLFSYCPFAQSDLYRSSQSALACTGHFVDLPLGDVADARGRDLVVSDAKLFGSYFRPRLADVEAGWLEGADEFSPLVEATLAPSLIAAHAVGGMWNLYRQWVAWIGKTNEQRGASAHRRYYGSPIDFVDFLIAEPLSHPDAAPHAISLAQVTRVNLALSASLDSAPISMASYRSYSNADQIELGDTLELDQTVAVLRTDFDVSPFFESRAIGSGHEVAHRPLFLAWQRGPGGVRLIKIDAIVYHSLRCLETRPMSVAELLLQWTEQRQIADFDGACRDLSVAVQSGLVKRHGTVTH